MSVIYLDHAATTPVRPEVRAAMLPFLGERYGNPSSTHAIGRAARSALEEARERLAGALGAAPREIVFTGGGTEADNLAVLGVWRAARRAASPERYPAVACSAVEHSAVLHACRAAGREGAPVLLMGVDESGGVLEDAFEEALAARPAVVSVQWGNNEVGTLQPVGTLGRRCRDAGVPFHSDAVQALGKVPVHIDAVPVDLLSVSAHKIGGPQGVGALFVRDGITVEPLLHGGGQERGLRSGTHAVAGAIGLAVAAELAADELEAESARIRALRDRLEAGLRRTVPDLAVNGAASDRLPHISSVTLPGVESDVALVSLDLEGICASAGSACHSGASDPGHVLVSMGGVRGPEDGAVPAVLRFSLGRTTTAAEVDLALRTVASVLERIRVPFPG